MDTDFNQEASYAWDHIVLEKNDRAWNEIKPDGTLTTRHAW
jgi:hypothetical protein